MLDQPCTQEQFGILVGIAQQTVSELVNEGVLARGATAGVWVLAYTARLREQAAGRATKGDIDLATERAFLAREQKDRVAMQNAVTRRELAPVAFLETCLAQIARQIAAHLEAIPVNLKRRSTGISDEDLAFLTDEINKARNLAADSKLDWSELDGQTDEVDIVVDGDVES